MWPQAVVHAADMRAAHMPAPDGAKTRWEAATGSPFKGVDIPFAALVKFKPLRPNTVSKLGTNMRYALFAPPH